MPDLYVINIKPKHWKTCRKDMIFGIRHRGRVPSSWRQERWKEGDLCLVRFTDKRPNYGVRAIWYFESEQKIKTQAENPWKDLELEWKVQLKPLVLEFKTLFFEDFRTESKYSDKVQMLATRLQPTVVKLTNSETDHYLAPLLKEKEDEITVEVTYMGTKVRLDSLLNSVTKTGTPLIPKSKQADEWALRKYGFGGEGEDHKKLKKWIFEHPSVLGLHRIIRRNMEYGFPTGDRADLAFEMIGRRYAVVEIETDNPTPGAYQALKYKVLRCAELGLDVKSPNITPILVAWYRPKNIEFCSKYGIQFVRKKLER
jgi:hypothetical protein